MSSHSKGSIDERDVAEVKKAIATGQTKETSASPGMHPRPNFLMESPECADSTANRLLLPGFYFNDRGE